MDQGAALSLFNWDLNSLFFIPYFIEAEGGN